jgi:hypothetical protein
MPDVVDFLLSLCQNNIANALFVDIFVHTFIDEFIDTHLNRWAVDNC